MPPVRCRLPATTGLLVAFVYAIFSSAFIFHSKVAINATGSSDLTAVATTSKAPSKHNKRSTTSYMWYRGNEFDPLDEKRPPESGHNITIDALSIGTQYNVPQMEGQAKSWASHWSVRYLFGTTEQDDADPTCHERLTQRQFMYFFPTCHQKTYHNNRLRPIRSRFPIEKWIAKENKTIGWLCAQQRFAHAIGKVGRFYRREGRKLPDFLFIQDDDTWYGMNQMVSFLSTRNHSVPFTTAGCMIHWPVHFVNFSFPYGGFGTVLNRLAVERLIKPIYCNRTIAITSPDDAHTKQVCRRIEENLAGERMAFQEGFSISDLMDQHAAMLPYRRYRRWKNDPGYCMLGDWVIGYYINYYALGSRQDPSLDYIHMDHSLGYDYSHRVGSCLNDGIDRCWESDTKYACHRIPPDTMLALHENDAQNQPRSS